jgi:YidC/Oxa1 family membrane protein insertase
MDRQTTLGFILIGVVLIAWMWLQAPSPPQTPSVDSLAVQAAPPPAPAPEPQEPLLPKETPEEIASPSKYFEGRAAGDEKVMVVRTDLYVAEISTRGGLVRKWELRDYKTWRGTPVEMVDFERGGDLSLLFTSSDGKLVNTRFLYFDAPFRPWTQLNLEGDQRHTVEFTLPLEGHRRLVKRMTFVNGTYDLHVEWRFENMREVISNFEYQVLWENGIPYAERNSVDESNYSYAYAYSGGELTELDASKVGQQAEKDIGGSTAWVALRNKYFGIALIPQEGEARGAYLEGIASALPDKGVHEEYSVALKMPYRGADREGSSVTVFMGPLAEYIMIPLFSFLRMLIPNYGVVIIVFAFLIKVALHPLSKTSMKSMKKMQALTPLMNEIREKHKDNPEKMNQQIMNLYKEYGVNPAAGCLPLLLQMPILFALWSVLRSSIELRQASFVWWIKDLSIPDTVMTLPFTIPLLGMHEVSGLALAMGVTMFIQQKMTVTDPRQKAMVWMMPVMLTLLFNSLPSGLNLYYFVFNLLSIVQQVFINKQHGAEPLRKVDPKKRSGGIMAKLTKDLPKLR